MKNLGVGMLLNCITEEVEIGGSSGLAGQLALTFSSDPRFRGETLSQAVREMCLRTTSDHHVHRHMHLRMQVPAQTHTSVYIHTNTQNAESQAIAPDPRFCSPAWSMPTGHVLV